MKICCFYFFIIIPSFLFAQKEANIWYFGDKAGIDFNNTPPTPLTNGQLSSTEGCSSIADNAGNLLFYTDGMKVWNKKHSLMLNGNNLMGNGSSSQSALIVKKPASNNIFYIFTVDREAGSNGCRYSEVDMNLNNGFGAVTSNKNKLIVNYTCEKVIAIRHENKIDYWIITHLFNSNTFRCYLLTANGLSQNPISNNIGSFISNNQVKNTIGCMKGSTKGNKLALANLGMNQVEVFDFDNSTGILKNPLTINFSSEQNPYGVEFSPNNNLLYVSVLGSPRYLFQYNLNAGSSNDIINSRVTLQTTDRGICAIQLAPDNKIYCSIFNLRNLGVINFPDRVGVTCDYKQTGFNLSNRNGWYGLPAFHNVFEYSGTPISAYNSCAGEESQFSFYANNPVDSVIWTFDDLISGNNNTSTLFSPTHIFSNSGTYQVRLIRYFGNIPDTSTSPIVINPMPEITLGNDLSFCDGESTILDVTTVDASYLWQDNSTNAAINVNQAGTYRVEVTVNKCTATDEINVSYYPIPEVNLGIDVTLCENEKLILDATYPSATYRWQNNTTDPTFTASQTGTYWVEVSANNCTAMDTININYYPMPVVDLGDDINLCGEESILLDVANVGATYLWQDNTTNSNLTVAQTGMYWVKVNLNDCIAYDTININYNAIPEIDLGNDLILCENESFTLDATLPDATYKWQNNTINSTLTAAQAGMYWVEVTVNNCASKDTINIAYKPLPVVDLGDDINICGEKTVLLDVTNAGATYLWQDNTTNSNLTVAQTGMYWVKVNLNDCIAYDTININYNAIPAVNLGDDLTLCEKETVTLDATTTDATYVWQNNTNNPTFQVIQAGIYWVEITVDGCASRDSINIKYNPLPVADLGDDFDLCEGEISILNATFPNATYRWQNNSTNPIFQVEQTGTYWVEVTDNNCSVRDSIHINYYPFPIVNLGADLTLCETETVTLDVTHTNATYHWQNNTTSPTFTVTQAGMYWVDVTVNNCATRDSIHINYTPLPIVELGDDFTLCEGESYTLDASLPNATYLWQDNTFNSIFTVDQAGTYWVEVTADNCSARDSINVNYTPLPVVTLGEDLILCEKETVILDATHPNAFYKWQDNATNPTYTVAQAGTYWVEVTALDCSARDSINIQYKPLPELDLGGDFDLCDGETATLDATFPNTTYFWQDNSTNPTFQVEQSGLYWVIATLNDCSVKDTIDVMFHPFPIVNLGNDSTLCEKETYTLDASFPNASYLWQDNTSSPTFQIVQAGTYWVEVTTNHCATRDTINIKYNPLPVVDLGENIDLCEGETITLDASLPNATYLWLDNSTQPTFTVEEQGVYQVFVTVDLCSNTDLKSVTYTQTPRVNLGPDLTPCEGETIILDAMNINAQYTWQNNASTSKIFVRESGKYWVEVSNRCGIKIDSVSFVFKNCHCGLFVPTAFTPNNGDNTNDVFQPIPSCEISEYTMTIYDGWGEKVFETADIQSGWDGTHVGNRCKNGVYAYHIKYRNEISKFEMVNGYVNLLK